MTTAPPARRAGRRPGRDVALKQRSGSANKNDASRSTPGDDFRVVGLGASAGGLEALYKLLDALPADTGMAFVVVMHLDPTHTSMMADLLTGHTAMTVTEAADGMRIEPDRIYVIPPAAYLSVDAGALRLTDPPERRGARMPFDVFLDSLAKDCGARAVCVVLSGSGADGSAGLSAVRDNGGLVIVQEPAEAAHVGMPHNAILTGAVHFVLPAAAIPAALLKHGRNPTPTGRPEREHAEPSPDGGPALAGIIDLLRTHTSLDFAFYKEGTLVRQIERRMASAAIRDMASYLGAIRQNPDEIGRLAKDMLIHVTHFFRDKEAFDVMAETILPEMIDRQPLASPIRIWDAGCSTGEETYSIAMLFLEAIEASRRNVRLQLFASDVADEALTTARNGLYPETISKDVSPERLARFFTKEGQGYRVTRELRETVVFTTQDLLADAPFSRLDFVSCRNVLIYLRPEVQEKALSLFHFSLRDGGVLFLGASEAVGNFRDHFSPISKKHRIFRHLGRSRPGEVAFPITPGKGDRARIAQLPRRNPELAAGPTMASLAREALLDAYAPASVLINGRDDGLHYFGPVDRYLKVPTGEASKNLLSMAREGLRTKLRATIRKAGREPASVTTARAQMQRDGVAVPVRLSIRPVQSDGEGLLLVSFADEAEQETGDREGSASADLPHAAQLEQDLDAARKELDGAIHDFEATNDELTAANEDAMSINEELQSTNEELETSKEELQSLNEELTALNSQLSGTIEHQRSTANDLRNTMNSSEIAMLFLDSDLKIRLFTPAASAMFNVIVSDIGRPLADLARRINDPLLLADASGVIAGDVAPNREIEADDGAWYTRRVVPYRDHDDQVEGVVITFTDISEGKAAERAIEAARSYSDSIINTIRQPLVVLDADLRVISASRSFYDAFSVDPAETVGRRLDALDDGRLDNAALREFLDRLARGERVIEEHQVDLDTPAQGVRRLLANALEIRGESAGGRQILVMIDDVTERLRVNEALEQARRVAEQANLGKSRFLAAASHDLRQPLQTLSLVRGILAKRIDDEAGSRLIAKFEETLGAMSGMLNTLLDINQLEAGIVHPEIVDFSIGTVFDRLKTEFAYHMTTKQLEWRVVANSLEVRSDPRLLEQMLRNLLANAVKYTERGSVLLGSRRQGDRLHIEVWDTGIGVPADQLETIFEEFSQLDNPARERNRGLGLGLSIVRRVGDLLDHPIDIRSWPGRGSMFAVSVQISEDNQRLSGRGGREEAAGVAGAILIVEDDPMVREMLGMLIEGEGHRVTTVAGGNEALELAARAVFLPEMIIADYNLPGDLTGADVIARMREKLRADIPAIVLTGDISSNTLTRIAEAGCVHLSKPAEPEMLTQQIAGLLSEARRAKPPAILPQMFPLTRGPGPTVFVVDDDSGSRDDMQELLRAHGYAAETYASGEAFLDAGRSERNGCLVIDAMMPGMGGIALLERLTAANHDCPAIIITGYGDVTMAVQAMKAGAADFLEKPVRASDLIASIARASERSQDVVQRSAWRQTAVERVAGLTPREREVMDLVVQGRPNKIIADVLGIGQRTVENHRAAVMKRTGATTLADLIRLVMAATDGQQAET